MTIETLEERVAVLEARLDQLQNALQPQAAPPENRQKRGWQAIIGTFANDPL